MDTPNFGAVRMCAGCGLPISFDFTTALVYDAEAGGIVLLTAHPTDQACFAEEARRAALAAGCAPSNDFGLTLAHNNYLRLGVPAAVRATVDA